MFIMKNLYPSPNRSLAYNILIQEILGATFLNFPEYKTMEAIAVTTTGIVANENAKAINEEGHVFVST